MKHREFIEYVFQFYGPNGLYPIKGITVRLVRLGIAMRGSNFEGDSIDREAIRDLILVATNQVGGAFGGIK